MNLVPAAVQKTIAEGSCRVCNRSDIETAHLWPKGRGGGGYDKPHACVPLCKRHHMQFDAHKLDLLPYLSIEEQLACVELAGGISRAYNRLTYEPDNGARL